MGGVCLRIKKLNDTYTALFSKLSKDCLVGFCKKVFLFLIANGAFFLILLIIYQNMDRALFIYFGLLLGYMIMNPLSILLHHLALYICKTRDKKFAHRSISYTRSECIGCACIMLFLFFKIIRIEMQASNFIITCIVLAILFLIIETIITSVTIAKELPFKGLLGAIMKYNTIINYEFALSARIKGSVCYHKKEFKGAIVKTMNLVNLRFSSFISIFYVWKAPIVLQYFNKTPTNIHILWFLILSFPIVSRTIARSVEIMIAFFIDTIDSNKKQTNIQPHERVILATFSLIEITLLFAAVYLFIDISSLFQMIPNVDESLYRNFDNIYFFFYSFGITTYKSVAFKDLGNTHRLAILLQVITSMVLILFTLARYIGEIKEEKRNRNR